MRKAANFGVLAYLVERNPSRSTTDIINELRK